MTKFVLSKVKMISCGRECLASSTLKSKSVLFRGEKTSLNFILLSLTLECKFNGRTGMRHSKGQIRSFKKAVINVTT